MGRLTTHILDTAHGCPAAGVAIALWWLGTDLQQQPPDSICLHRTLTNQDGRTDQPLLEGTDFRAGHYELRFDIGDYFARRSLSPSSQPSISFLTQIPIRFGIADPSVHYHVPLLVSPWSYSTYRGS